MKSALFALSASLLLGSSVAVSLHERHHNHEEFHKKRAIEEGVCTTYVTTFTGEAGLYNPPPATTTELSTVSVMPIVSSTSSTPPPPPPTSAAPPPPPPPPPAPKPKPQVLKAAAPVVTGNKWCMTYSPYQSNGACKDAGAVEQDIANIAKSGFSAVRIYSTDCGGLQSVGDAVKKHGLKLVAGVYIDGSGLGPAGQQVEALISWGQWELVEMIVLGNEALFNGFVDVGSLVSFIKSSKGKFQSAGYTGPVTTSEPLNILQSQGQALCSIIDVIGANLHAFFNSEVEASSAGEFIAKEIEALGQTCPGLTPYNLETGWPSSGSANGAAVPGTAEQKAAIDSIVSLAGGKSAFFSFENDLWKQPGQYGVEQNFGCGHLF